MKAAVTCTPNAALDLWMRTERLEGDRKLRCSEPQIDPGGGGINVSRSLRRLERETLAVFAAGGFVGDRVAAALEREGVPSDRLEIAEETRQDFTVLEESSGRSFRFVTPGPPLSLDEGQALLQRVDSHLESASMVVASGSLPQGMSDDFYGRLAAVAKRRGAPMLLDSSDGIDAALEQGLFLLRLNRRELAQQAGKTLDWPMDHVSWAERRVAAGTCDLVAVTHGADGAVLVGRKRRLWARPPEVRIKSAVGAGDSFMAGLCAGFAEGGAPADALRLGVATAVATLLTPGTELFRRQDVEALLPQCAPPREL